MAGIKTALVIGGGIAGPVAALALRKAGIEATVYEAYDAAAIDAGAMLTVAPNGLAALDVVGLGSAVRAAGHDLHAMVMEKGSGKPLMTFAALPGLPPSCTILRRELFRVIREGAGAAGIAVAYGKRLVGVEEGPDSVSAKFEDGSSASADVLIGADGIHSVVRSLIDPAAPGPQYTGLVSFGFGEFSADGCLLDAGRGPIDTMHFAFGKKSFYGYWKQPDGTDAFFSNFPQRQPMSLAEARAVPKEEWLAKLRASHVGDRPGERLFAQTSVDKMLVAGPMERMPSVPHWHRGRMVLLGDSVHAPSSSSGQGASLAVESAVELARCLRDIDDVTAAFAAYEKLRRERVEKISEQAAKTNSGKTNGAAANLVFGLLMPILSRTILVPEKMFGPAHRFQIDWDERVSADAA
jgi:2-polyprenyl-6-methoxyphenol hydroxylase-like FAD-dependent oxidoreductase